MLWLSLQRREMETKCEAAAWKIHEILKTFNAAGMVRCRSKVVVNAGRLIPPKIMIEKKMLWCIFCSRKYLN